MDSRCGTSPTEMNVRTILGRRSGLNVMKEQLHVCRAFRRKGQQPPSLRLRGKRERAASSPSGPSTTSRGIGAEARRSGRWGVSSRTVVGQNDRALPLLCGKRGG